jgi:hypothetical protein
MDSRYQCTGMRPERSLQRHNGSMRILLGAIELHAKNNPNKVMLATEGAPCNLQRMF